MYKDHSIAVVVPAHNEGKIIGSVLSTMPDYVDRIIVVDDCSTDNTYQVVESFQSQLDEKLIVIRHENNQGVGGACISGYKRFLEEENLDIAVIMAGDGQMPPEDLPAILEPVITGRADYSKNNRLLSGQYLRNMPRLRIYGNSILSLLTKIASGYWHVVDSQSGYTAITRQVLETIELDKVYKGYGWCNDLLIKMNIFNFRVIDVPLKPVYGQEKSGIKLGSYIPKVSWLLLKGFFWRLKEKFILRDFHPLILFYMIGSICMVAGLGLGIWIIVETAPAGGTSPQAMISLCVLLIIIGMQSIFFAMLFDKQETDRRD